MAAITLTLDPASYRIGVDLSDWSTSGTVEVLRVHQDGTRHPVRGMSAVSGGVGFAWDYEAPLSAPVTYEAMDGGTLVSSAPGALVVPHCTALLTVPGMPSFGGVVSPIGKVSPRRARAAVEIDIIGRGTDITKYDVLKSASFDLTLRTKTDAEAYALTAMVAIAPILLLRMPGTRVTDWCYVGVRSLAEAPFVHYKAEPGASPSDVAYWATWSLDCRVEDAPIGDVVGAPNSTWQALKDTGKTWDQIKDLTWLDVLKGEALA